jgi:RNA ligase (TIGR02306 family)
MASSVIVPIVALQNVRQHPNADKLELCDVLGYPLVIVKGQFKTGDIGVYFPAGTIIPFKWSEKFGVSKYLRGAKHNRVGQVALRGEPSFGLFVPIPEGLTANVGDNVAEFFNAQKYIPPMKSTDGDAEKYDENIDPYVKRYTDIENGRIFVDVFEPGEEVVVTEKIHGTNCKVGFIWDKEFDMYVAVASSMEIRRKRPQKTTLPKNIVEKIARKICYNYNKPKTALQRFAKHFCGDVYVNAEIDDKEFLQNRYWFPHSIKAVQRMLKGLREIYEDPTSILLYGEVYGSGIYFAYDRPNSLGFRLFDISINGRYLNWNDFVLYTKLFKVPTVPVLYVGPYKPELIQLAEGNTSIEGAKNIKEGIVIKPVIERQNDKTGRTILKFIGTQYDLQKNDADDTSDV